MNGLALQKVSWKQKKKSAELWFSEKLIATISFGSKKTIVQFTDHRWEIRSEGFWWPQIVIKEKNKVLLTQKNIGFWGVKNEVLIDNRVYTATTKQATLYNVSYTNASGGVVVSYALTAAKWKAPVNFTVNAGDTPEQDVLLVFILGYYTMRAVILENNAADVASTNR